MVAGDGSIEYDGLNLTIGKDIYEVRVGDAVMLRGDDDDAGLDTKPAAQTTEPKVGDGLMLARVERIWQEKSKGGRSGKILFQARWFLKVRTNARISIGYEFELSVLNSCNGFCDAVLMFRHFLTASTRSCRKMILTLCLSVK